MSRKKKQTAPVDTGGLDLTLPPPPANEPTIDVTAAPSNAHKAVEELETLPPSQSVEPAWGEPGTTTTDGAGNVWYNVQPIGNLYMHEPGDLDNCVFANEALHMSALWLAVRLTNNPDVLVVYNGTRHWTVDAKKFEPTLAEGIINITGFSHAAVWRPVAGNERGWYVG